MFAALRDYLKRFRANHRAHGWVAEDPDPGYSSLDEFDGLGQVPDPIPTLRTLRATCKCSPNQRSECTVCGPMSV